MSSVIKIIPHSIQPSLTRLSGVKNTIAIASGKGGVGKSTVTAHLAFALQALGLKVGILDADIYGPSQPTLMGLSGKPEITDNQFIPLRAHEIPVMSIGFLIDEAAPAVWRGPMISKALEQLAFQSQWGDLDILLIDLPPGTGDIQLTLSQKIPLTGVLVVTTPQDLSLKDARKALKMFQKVTIPVLGIIENMSVYHYAACGHEAFLFGKKGGEKLAQETQVPVLGHLPLDSLIQEYADNGNTADFYDKEHALTKAYRAIAEKALEKLAVLPKDYQSAFGKIEIKND